MSAEGNKPEAQELELWDRIRTTEGAERAEVLDELSHFAYKKNNFTECLQLIETSIEIYFNLTAEFHTKQLIHLYEGKAFCHSNLDQSAEAAEAFETLAGYFCIDEDREGFLRAKRAAGREWYSAENYERSLECHTIVSKELDINSNDYSMGIDNLNIGMALQCLERHEEAVKYFLIARPLFKKAKNPEFVNWCDRHLSQSYSALKNGMEAAFHAKHYFNFSKISENLEMESYARYRLGQAHWLLKEYEEAESQFTRSLELLTLEGERDWETIVKANNELAAVLFALGKDEEAKERLDRIATLEETISVE
ncbi:Tetratricopeptide repeat [Candidatus Nanopelagicaceae bacterium]